MRLDFDDYFSTSLAEFYISPAHRWLVYAAIFIFSGLTAFGALYIYDIRYGYDLYNEIPLSFKGMYAWNSAANFTIWFCATDLLFAVATLSWGRYDRRTVGRTWCVFFSAYLPGFISQRILVYQMVDLYYPMWILRHEMYPLERPGALPMFLFMLPFWLVIGYAVIRFILSMQARAEELLRVRVDTILEERTPRNKNGRPPVRETPPEEEHLQLPTDPGVAPIRQSHIGHVTVEDHYLRIYYHIDGNRRDTLVRMPLKALIDRLPAHQFVRIHRSHIVNLQWISGVKRAGRDVRLTMKHGEFELPVSRYRLPQLLPVLDQFLDRTQNGLKKSIA